jgi:hypothetical protein
MITPFTFLIASLGLGQAPGLILPELVPPELPPAFAEEGLQKGLSGLSVVQACDYLGEGVPLCYRLVQEGRGRWFSLGEAENWGVSQSMLSQAVEFDRGANPFVQKSVEGGGKWWQVEALSGRHSLVFLNPDWLEAVGPAAVVASPAKGVVIAWNTGDPENDQIMAVGVRRIYETHDAPVTPLIFRWHEDTWVVWGEARSRSDEAARPSAN